MKFKIMNSCDMTYQNEQFDLIVDKGTTDAILQGNMGYYNFARMVKEC